MAQTDTTRALVQKILEKPLLFEGWTIQGLGMLRLYLDAAHKTRLHVWTTAHAAKIKASELHTHPWDFDSQVVAGVVHNTRYFELSEEEAEGVSNAALWQRQKIRCGEGGGLVGAPERVFLADSPETFKAGECYSQKASEIHKSNPEDGTVTIIERIFGADTEHAYVYFPVDEEWITAEPRPATDEEILTICGNALDRWFR